MFLLVGCTGPDDPSLSPDEQPTVVPPTVAGPSGDVAGQTPDGADPGSDLYRVDLASGDAEPIPSPLQEVRAPERSPDGSQLVYEGQSSTGVPQIFVFEDGRTRRLTHMPGGARDPTWSPDGSRIAFAGSRTPGETDTAIYVMAADGSDVRLVGGTGEGRRPDWSPDGSQLAFDDYVSIWAVSVEDGESTRLSPGPIELHHGPASEAAWSPDGRWIAFTRIEPGTINARVGAAHLWVMRSDGSRERRLGPERGHAICQVDATWSPDGSSVAFIDGSPSRRIGIVDVQTLTLAYLPTSFPVAHLSWGTDGLLASTGVHDLPISPDWGFGSVLGCPG